MCICDKEGWKRYILLCLSEESHRLLCGWNLPLWMKNIACRISKQRMLQPSSHHSTAAPRVSPEGTQDGSRMPAIKSSDTVATPRQCTLKRLKVTNHRILAPESWCAYQRNDFREPRLLHLPIHRKVLHSLTWDGWFSFINSNLLMFRLPGLCCKNSYVSWLPPCIFGAVSQSDLRCCVPG